MPQNDTPFLGQPCGDPVGGLVPTPGTHGTFRLLELDADGNLLVNVAAGSITIPPTTGTQTVVVAGTSTVTVVGGMGTSTVVVAGGTVDVTGSVNISGTSTVAVVGTSTVEVAGIVGTSTVTVAGVTEVSPTAAPNTRVNPFFNAVTDGTNVMGTMVAFGSNPGSALALNVNAAVQQGTVALAGTSTVEVAGIVGTSTVTVAGTVNVASTGTQTVTVVGTSTVAVSAIAGTPTVEVAGILGTSTVTMAGTVTVSASGTQTVTVAGSVSIAETPTVVVSGTSTVAVVGTSTVEIAGIAGTPTVEVAGILGTSTVTVAGTVTAACTGTQTVTVAGSIAAAVTGTQTVTVVGTSTVEVAGIIGTSTVTVAGTATVEIAGSLSNFTTPLGTIPLQTGLVGGVWNGLLPQPSGSSEAITLQMDSYGNAQVGIQNGVVGNSPSFTSAVSFAQTTGVLTYNFVFNEIPIQGQAVVLGVVFSAGAGAVSCKDSNGTPLTAHPNNNLLSSNTYLFYGYPSAGATATFTFTWTSSAEATFSGAIYGGVSGFGNYADQSTTSTIPNVAVQQRVGSSVVGFFSAEANTTATQRTSGGFLRTSIANATATQTVALVDITVNITAVNTADFTLGTSAQWWGLGIELLPATVVPLGGMVNTGISNPTLMPGQPCPMQLNSYGQLLVAVENDVVVAGTVVISEIVGTSTVEVAGIAGTSTVTVAGAVTVSVTGTSTVEVAGIIGTSTVAVAGTVTAACTGTQTVVVVGTSTVEVAGIVGTSTVEVAGIVGTSTVAVAGTSTISVTGQIGGSVAAGTAASSSILVGEVYNTAAPSLTNSQQAALQGDSSANVRVNPFGNVGSFKNPSVTTTITASATLQVAAATKWNLKTVRFTAIPSNTVTKQAVVWITDQAGNVMWEQASPVFTPTNTVMYECLLYQGATGPVNYAFNSSSYTVEVVGFVSSARGSATQVITLQIPEMYLGPSFQINAMLNGAAATATYSLSANVLQLSD